ncbi:hypothetical protein V2J09_010469 [Rumex salicifolius]
MAEVAGKGAQTFCVDNFTDLMIKDENTDNCYCEIESELRHLIEARDCTGHFSQLQKLILCCLCFQGNNRHLKNKPERYAFMKEKGNEVLDAQVRYPEPREVESLSERWDDVALVVKDVINGQYTWAESGLLCGPPSCFSCLSLCYWFPFLIMFI